MLDVERINEMYKDYYIKKPNGKYRHIQAPSQELKNEQYSVLNYLKSKSIPISKYAYGFVDNKNIFDNAKQHLQKECVFCIDLKNFFDGISKKTIKDVLSKYEIQNLEYILDILTRKGYAVQGAPTSPYISNIIFYEVDNLLGEYCKEKNITYTRYADDMTFSGKKEDLIPCRKNIVEIILSKGFKINWKKLETLYNTQRQEVTGILVNKNTNIKGYVRNKIRGICHSVERDINNKTIKNEKDLFDLYKIEKYKFLGYLNFLREANPSNEKYYRQFKNAITKI